MKTYPCLSVCQPWAWGIVSGDKPVENRTWPTRYRGPLLIHASKGRQYLGSQGPGELPGCPTESSLTFGALVGACTLVDCIPVEEARCRGFKYAEGPWCWLLDERRAFATPIPYRGAQGLFYVPEDVFSARRPESVPAGGLFAGGAA